MLARGFISSRRSNETFYIIGLGVGVLVSNKTFLIWLYAAFQPLLYSREDLILNVDSFNCLFSSSVLENARSMWPKFISRKSKSFPSLFEVYLFNSVKPSAIFLLYVILSTSQIVSANKRATERDLNANQFEQLKTAYVNTIVDSMSSKDLYQYVLNDMDNFVDKLTLNQLIEEIEYTLDEEFLDEMITTIKEKIKD